MILLYSISLFFLLVYSGLILFYRQSWLSIPKFFISEKEINHTKISVIIPARNEEQNIGNCLTTILQQNYPAHLFEVIVVDDHSTDATVAVVNSFLVDNVRLISLQNYTDGTPLNSYKKKAIDIAIQQSSGVLIVTTDADCIVPATWLQSIATFYEKCTPAFIAAPVAYYNENSFLKIFQSLDFITLQGITGASVHKQFHSMCNGANLAYERKAFDEVGGFKGIDNIASGDDMLLMYKIYQRYPERIQFLQSKQAIVQTQAMDTLGGFFNQRIRWASKSGKFDDKRIFFVLVLVYFFNVWIFLLGMIGLIATALHDAVSSLLYVVLGIVIIKTIIELLFTFPVARFFSKQKLLWWFPVAQPFHILYTIIAGWLGKFGSYQWKERKVH
ncbi:MAG TPA: glycosyltransferase [Ferruginibacter sp.]|jgi:cellulose synthase/poly-beta-1,6-N-acetylglucosamine synthase-like glycosyltransferase|nr:glycosyltransferase [Ferruginibacter sp.]